MERYFWITTLVIVALSFISGYDDPMNFGNMFDVALLCATVPSMFAFFFHVTRQKNQLFRFIWGTNFVLSATFTFVILSLTVLAVIVDGPLKESALIFMVMPFGYTSSFMVGCILGVLIYAINKDD